ncbi:MAG TPA: glycine/sarcosine/betaine reductase selenoprotein B family protein [Acidimicrobiales bacterium]|jgi:D-proline reductase (dithiol) PrdB|nr:glycine/sarcosine/betaine reductase selenoprotein B family protein [Acidimicrobiales bacterium]
MVDEVSRAAVARQPVPQFETTAWAPPARPLAASRVAIVTTAGLYREGDQGWSRGDQSFRVLPGGESEIRLGHQSANFDRSGFLADVNVVYPVDRLAEMVAEGVIGSVGAHNLSFMGAQGATLDTIRLDSGPAAAKLLRDDGVDVVVLTPV